MLKPLTKEIYQSLVGHLRHLKEGFYTNLFWNDSVHEAWIRHDELQYDELSDRSVVVVRSNDGFANLYYITANLSDLKASLKGWLKTHGEMYVCDVVGRAQDTAEVAALLIDCGCRQRRMLKRMVRLGDVDEAYTACGNISFATQADLPEIDALLHQCFDKVTEQLPKPYELISQIARREVILYKESQNLGGVIIFDNMKASMLLRFWIVKHEFRDHRVGSKLFNAMMHECSASKRQMHWVVADNDNAIKRYLHYGYKFDSLQDIVFTTE
jgi:N-acetylglutamate synthase-like GNAT family acetyltransferase